MWDPISSKFYIWLSGCWRVWLLKYSAKTFHLHNFSLANVCPCEKKKSWQILPILFQSPRFAARVAPTGMMPRKGNAKLWKKQRHIQVNKEAQATRAPCPAEIFDLCLQQAARSQCDWIQLFLSESSEQKDRKRSVLSERCFLLCIPQGSGSSRVSFPAFDWLLEYRPIVCYNPSSCHGYGLIMSYDVLCICRFVAGRVALKIAIAELRFIGLPLTSHETRILCRLFSRFFFCNSRACVRMNLSVPQLAIGCDSHWTGYWFQALPRQIARSVTTSFKVGLCIYGRLGPWQIYLLKLDLRNVVAVDCELTGLQCGGWDWGHLRSRLKKCGRFMTICKPSLCHGQVLSLLQQLEEDLWYQEKFFLSMLIKEAEHLWQEWLAHRLCSFVGKVVVLKLSSVLCYSTDSFFLDSLYQETSLTVREATTTNLLDNFLRDVGTKFAVCNHICCGTSHLG